MAVTDQRAEAVRGLIERVRGIESREGVTRASLEAIKAELIALATRSELFPREHFAGIPGRSGTIFHLAEDLDGRFALYGSAGVPGKAQPPHDHTTWASIAGVYGDEHNVFYECLDRDAVPGEGKLKKTHELTIRKGNACALMPQDFHTIEVTGGAESLHLHLYGKTLEDLPDRVTFGSAAGGKYARFMAKPEIFSPRVTAAELRQMLDDGGEIALLDVREEGVHAKGHPFLAASAPLSHLETRIARLVPRLSTRMVLLDDDERLAQRAAAVLRFMGYRGISVLAGGLPAWKAAGGEVYSGQYVPSKAFGEHVEHHDDTPRISAQELKAKLDAKEDLVVLDSRPLGEYRVMNIPGALDCPGAELVRRVHEAAPRPETLVVVNCAGRTRSIIGAQSLINAGIPNKVVALKNGTMGWHLAGLELERGSMRMAPTPKGEALAKAKEAAARVAKRFGVKSVTAAELEKMRADDSKTTYVFDVRTPEEYAAGHLEGSVSAPGGQLVQATDTYAAVRNARIVLIDDDGVRATMTASWLLQMGWPSVFTIDRAPAFGSAVEKTPSAPSCGRISVEELEQRLGSVEVLDFGTSIEYRKGHIPGASWMIRSRIPDHLAKLKEMKEIVCTSEWAAADLSRLLGRVIPVLEGGTAAWKAAGLPLETGETRMLDKPEDVYYKPYDHQSQIEAAMQDYLQWEVALLEQIRRDPDCRFKEYP
jgi:rhodanese-related sulfurtransferase/predicted metal-dependent enzyme (double-stranded beta helix superfamily)